MTDQTREEIDAKIAASEARTETKFAHLEGKLDLKFGLVLAKLDNVSMQLDSVKDDYRSIRANQWTIGLGLAVLFIGTLALLPSIFSFDAYIRDVVDHAVVAHTAPPK